MEPAKARPLWQRYLAIPIYLIVVVLLVRALAGMLGQVLPATAAAPKATLPFNTLMYGVVLQMIAFLLPAPLLLLYARARNYTFVSTPAREVLFACGWIVLTLVAFSIIYSALGIKPSQLAFLDMGDILKNSGAFLFITAVAVPAYEEWIFRGLIFGVLVTEATSRPQVIAAALFCSAIFTASHIEGMHSLSALPAILAMSLVLHFVTWRTGSLWPAVCAHSLQNLLSASAMLATAAKTTAN